MSESTEDDLLGDLRNIISESRIQENVQGGLYENKLIEKLIIYIVNRDGKVLGHGIKIGKEMENGK